jgi:hypothetical protein
LKSRRSSRVNARPKKGWRRSFDPVIGHIRKDIAAAREYGFNRANKTRTSFGAGFDTLYPSKASVRIGDDTTRDPDDASQNAVWTATLSFLVGRAVFSPGILNRFSEGRSLGRCASSGQR